MLSHPPPSAGLVGGKYELLGLIGRGGMGSVWEARHVSLGSTVAIKFIEAEYAQSDEARKRFDNEARAAATLQSKHAIHIFDHGVTEDGRPYIVMERLRGEPLDKRIERLGRLPLADTARIIQQVCRALGRAHEVGIIHRDLKPENIFLVRAPDDDDEIAKVLDFGIAKVRKETHEAGVSTSTRTGAVLGTPYYMSPEQARGLRTVDHRADLWSLGVITYKCVTGALPFEGESLGDLLVKICTAPLPVPSHVAPGLPPSFDAWFHRALDRDPSRRFQSAQELAEGLLYAAGLSAVRPPGSYTPSPQAAFPGVTSPAPAAYGASGTPLPSAPLHASGTTPYGVSSGPSATSAPFVRSTDASGSGPSKTTLFVAFSLAVFVVGAGVAGYMKLRGASRAVQGTLTVSATATSAPTTAVALGTVAPGSGATAAPTDTSEPLAPLPPLTSPNTPMRASPAGGKPQGKPAPTPKPPAAKPTTSVAPPPTTAFPPPAPPPTTTATPKPTAKPGADPGF
jgi:serine/threonine-protein kinase